MSKEEAKHDHKEQVLVGISITRPEDVIMFESPRKTEPKSSLNQKHLQISPLIKSNSKNKGKNNIASEKIPPNNKDQNSSKASEKNTDDQVNSSLIVTKTNNKNEENAYSLKEENSSMINTGKEIQISEIVNPGESDLEQKKRKKEWKSWSLNEKLLFYEIIANGANHSSLQKLFKNMTDVNFQLFSLNFHILYVIFMLFTYLLF